MKWTFLSIFFFVSFCSVAQVVVHEPAEMSRVTQEYAAMYPAEEEIQGWAILVALNRDRRKIDEIQSDFKYRYPELREHVEWKFENPYYKLTVGAFADRESTLPLLHKIRKHYNGAFEVKSSFPRKDVMQFRRLIRL